MLSVHSGKGVASKLSPADASANARCPDDSVSGTMPAVACELTVEQYAGLTVSGAYEYDLKRWACKRDPKSGECSNPVDCTGSDGRPGILASVWRRLVGAPEWESTPWTFCDTAPETKATITPAMAAVEMKRLAWPAPDLVIQPPGGRTLVNFPTNAYSRLAVDSVSQTVTVLGREVEIEATPEEFIWTWAQPGESAFAEDLTPLTTTSPGAPYEEGVELEVSHEYRDAGVTVTASVSVTYRGRFRVDGGEWQDIPDTLTLAGGSQSIEVLEAHAKLVS